MERRKFVNGQMTVKQIMTNSELFFEFIEKKEVDQNCIKNCLKSSTLVEDSLALFSAVNFGWQPKGTRLAKNNTLQKVSEFIQHDNREGFDHFWNSRARSGTHTVYTTNSIETCMSKELYSGSTLDLLIDEDNEREAEELEALKMLGDLEKLVDRKLQEKPWTGLFSEEEMEEEYVRAGNKYPKKVLKVKKDDVNNNSNLFDMMEV
jgi:hypothetical protein